MHALLDQLEDHAARRGAHLATCDPNLELDYRAFRALAYGLGERLRRDCADPRVGILAPSSTGCAVALFACWYARKTPVPLNFLLAPEELGRVVRDADLKLVLAAEQLAPAATVAGLDVLPLNAGTMVAGAGRPPDVQPDECAAIVYTSGTTGDPKGACLTFDNLARNVEACATAAGLNGDNVFLGLLPQFHAFGLTTNTLVPLLLGATVHYLPRFSPVTVANLIAAKRVSVFIAIASMFGALAAMKNARRAQFASLTHPVSGGEPLSPKVARIWEERFGRPIYQGYGMTETSPVVTLNVPGANRPGSVGRALPGVSVVAVDAEGRTLPPGRDGELVVRGHCVMRGYLNKLEQTAETIRDGALWTGDVGHVDADGYVSITGRAKEMIIVGGENVFPFEVECALLDHPQVAETAVVGIPDEVRGEVPVAFVILEEGSSAPSEAELREFCRRNLATYKVPRRIRIEVDLPRGPTGKIAKRELRSWVT